MNHGRSAPLKLEIMTIKRQKEIAESAKMLFSSVFAFRNSANAFSFANRCFKITMVMVVEDEFWAVTPVEARRLSRLGYLYANQ